METFLIVFLTLYSVAATSFVVFLLKYLFDTNRMYTDLQWQLRGHLEDISEIFNALEGYGFVESKKLARFFNALRAANRDNERFIKLLMGVEDTEEERILIEDDSDPSLAKSQIPPMKVTNGGVINGKK